MVGEQVDQVQFLLDHQHGEPPFLVEAADDFGDVVDDIGLDAFGGLVENQEAGVEHEGAADGELLLLAAGEVAAAPLFHVEEHGKELVYHFGHIAGALVAAFVVHGQADFEVVFYGELGKYLPALRHIGDAMVGAFFGALFEQVDVAVFQGVGLGGHLPHDGFEQGGFAHAVAADDAGAGFFGRGEADVVQNVALAVGLVEVFDGEHFASFLGRLNRFQTASGCGGGVGYGFSIFSVVGQILESDACSQNKYQAGGGCRIRVSDLHGFQTASDCAAVNPFGVGRILESDACSQNNIFR